MILPELGLVTALQEACALAVQGPCVTERVVHLEIGQLESGFDLLVRVLGRVLWVVDLLVMRVTYVSRSIELDQTCSILGGSSGSHIMNMGSVRTLVAERGEPEPDPAGLGLVSRVSRPDAGKGGLVSQASRPDAGKD